MFPKAVEILDYYHLSERLHKVALAQFYDDPLKQRQWVEATKARLFFGYVDWVLVDLEQVDPRKKSRRRKSGSCWATSRRTRGG